MTPVTTPPFVVRNALHTKYQRVLRLSEPEMRWCERVSAWSLKPLTMVLTQYAKTRQDLTGVEPGLPRPVSAERTRPLEFVTPSASE
jgi:hypothetical protein